MDSTSPLTPRAARALQTMVDELRAEQPPELPWSAIEERVLAEIDRSEERAAAVKAARAARREPPGLYRVLGFAAAAAALVFGITTVSRTGELRTAKEPEPQQVDVVSVGLARGEPGTRGELDLLGLRRGDVVEAGDRPVTFSHAGAVAWTLAAGGRVRVLAMGDAGVGHTVALERGAIRAEVTPRDASEGLVEAFAVEVGGTRVAVHGTAFSVAHRGDRVEVDVEHGAIAVGPVGHVGATTGHLLIGPSRASFSLDGGRTARFLPRSSEPAPLAIGGKPSPTDVLAALPQEPIARAEADAPPPSVEPPSAPQKAPAHAPPGKAAAAAPEIAPPAPPPVTLTPDVMKSRLNACFRRVYDGSSSTVHVSVSSTLKLVLGDDGSVVAARFDPPLKVELQECAGGAIGGRFAPGAKKLDIPVSFTP